MVKYEKNPRNREKIFLILNILWPQQNAFSLIIRVCKTPADSHSTPELLYFFFTFNRESRIRALFNKFSMEKESSTRVKIYFDYCRCCESFSVHFHSSWEHFSFDKFLQIRTTICVQTSATWRQRRNDAKKCMDSFKVEADLSFHFLISPVTESYKCRVGRSHYARG